ncbi:MULTISPECIES: hypothetical protein [Candidatus Ichthyocystis]|uniref:hypothetical protein n=1 Tax=Candidatus Ichthyocystis TaxID=2929841 RepID=UPI000B843579|nr:MULTISPECIES: hypothetical protein [Ichthyocystis]
MHSLLLLAVIIAFFCDRFLNSRIALHSSRLFFYVVSKSFKMLSTMLPLGLTLFCIPFFLATIVWGVLFLIYHLNIVFYLVLVVLLYISLVPFHSFVIDSYPDTDSSDGHQFTSKGSAVISVWAEQYGLSVDENSYSDVCWAGLLFERIIFAPLLWSLVIGPWGLVFYFSYSQTKKFLATQCLSSPFFLGIFEWCDLIPSRLMGLFMCLLTNFSNFFHRVDWFSYPPNFVPGNSDKFTLSFLQLFFLHDDSSSVVQDSDLDNKAFSLFRRTYYGMMMIVFALLIIQATVLF